MPSERYLAIETSSPRLSLAAGDEEKILSRYQGPLSWRHADTLFMGLQRLLNRLRWEPAQLTGVAVSTGPGSFTGIRIGLSAARALGQSLKIPVVGICSLEVMAYQAALEGEKENRWFCPMIDALRGQVFSSLYERTASGSFQCVWKETMAPMEAWLKKVKARTRGRALWISSLQDHYPDASVLLGRARPLFRKAGKGSYRGVFPLYIREAAAVERRKSSRR